MNLALKRPTSTGRVLLVDPPWRPPHEGSLSIATLRPLLVRAGYEADSLFGSLEYRTRRADSALLGAYAGLLFAPYLQGAGGELPDLEPFIDDFLTRFLEVENLSGLVVPGATSIAELGHDVDALRQLFRDEVVNAGACLNAALERIVAGDYDLVAMSATFENQLPAALALARRLRAGRPELPIILGGAACFEELGGALARAFPELTAVCHCEGEGVIIPLVGALLAGTPLDGVPGIAWLDAATRELHTTPAPALLRTMDELPYPDYGDFVAALAASDVTEHPPTLFFETSRGCWWGQKTLCTFCGLNAEGLAFRSKSADRAVAEISALHERYRASALHATDNILEMAYLETVLPRLRHLASERERPLRLFYEVKPNLRKEQVRVLRDAGVHVVQPGIESFSDGVLAVMRKGNRALGQLQFLKWATECGITPMYNILVRNPGEAVSDYETMLALIPMIEHLHPPRAVSTTWLERFSPYFNDPEAYGITAVRASAHYASMYPEAEVPLDELAYVFDFDHALARDPVALETHHRFVRRVGLWQYRWRPGKLVYGRTDEGIMVMDQREETPRRDLLIGDYAQVFEAFDRARAVRRVEDELPGVDVVEVLDFFLERRWACRDERGRALVLVPEAPIHR